MLVPVTDDNNEEFETDYYEALIYGERNSERMRDYHRLDIGFTKRTLIKTWKLPVEWTFSIYNAYNRRNPYHYYYSDRSGPEIWRPEYGHDIGKLSLYQMSFFPIIPSISYKVYFHKGFKASAGERSLKQKTRKFLYHE